MLPVKQSSGLSARPDLIAVPVDASTWRPIYSKAVAIEIESCNEVEVHPDQVAHNWVKESVRDFAEVHTWTWDRCFDRLREIYERTSIDRAKVRIFSARWSGAGEVKSFLIFSTALFFAITTTYFPTLSIFISPHFSSV